MSSSLDLETTCRGRNVIMGLVLTLLLSTGVASAHRFGGQFPHTAGNWLYVGYTQNGAYRTQVVNAGSSWHYTPTKVVVYETAYAYSKADFYGYYYSDSWWGLAVHHPCAGWGCSYHYADLYLNTRTLGVESDFIKQKVAAHEFGHGLGLAHNTDSWYSSIMKQGYLSYNTPQNHDINDTNDIYR
jgi:hypothetical protein